MFPSHRPQSAELPDDATPGLSAILLPAQPTPSANFLKIPAACPRSARTVKLRPPSILQIPQPLCPGIAAASSSPNASSRDRPSSLARRRSAPLCCPCARRARSCRASRGGPARYFGLSASDHYTAWREHAPKLIQRLSAAHGYGISRKEITLYVIGFSEAATQQES